MAGHPGRAMSTPTVARYRRSMLLAVERVALLRHVEMFARTPGRVLAGMAHVLDEADFAPGELLMAEGAEEDWMYVVLEGEIDVTRADRHIRMGPGSTVGEMEVLDPQPRSATVTAVSQVRAFRLEKAAFDELLRLSPEIAHGVILELVRRLRETHSPQPPR
jgi:CRP/FNR family cyclic AMP-dependent transcriptional regulator